LRSIGEVTRARERGKRFIMRPAPAFARSRRVALVDHLALTACAACALAVSACSRSRTTSDDTIPPGGARCEARTYEVRTEALRTIEIYDYDAAGRLVRGEWQYPGLAIERHGMILTFEYDPAGRLATESKDEDADGKPETAERFTYDPSGRLAHIESVALPSTVTQSADLVYGESGRLTRTDWRRGGVVGPVETIAYSPDGTQRTTTTAQAGEVFRRTREELDGSGHVLRVYDQPGAPENARLRLETHYDPAGHVDSEASFDKLGAIESTTTFRYDPRGALQGTDVSNRLGLTARTVYTYRGAWQSARCGEIPIPK
jgi:hypothetical protein